MYGTQAVWRRLMQIVPFENDVKMYGTQAIFPKLPDVIMFENDVKMYGTQAGEAFKSRSYCLRMM